MRERNTETYHACLPGRKMTSMDIPFQCRKDCLEMGSPEAAEYLICSL